VKPIALIALAAISVCACATTAPPVTKIVNGQVIVTRSVSPEAYEHVTRAMLYEEEERWQDAAEELQRALPFDPDAPEVRADLAELFIRLDRLDDAADEVARSLAIAPTVDGYLAKAHLAEAQPDEARRAAAIPALQEAANLALEDQDPEAVERAHLELADGQIVALDLAGALATLQRLAQAAPETLHGRVQLAAVAWPLGDLDAAAAALHAAIDQEPNDVEARLLLAELQVARNQVKEAKDSFNAAIDRADAPLEIADAYAGWLMLRGEEAEARELADRLIADAGSAEALVAASGLERTVKRPDRAVALAERAQKLGASAGQAALLVGAARALNDDRAGALKSYQSVAHGDAAFFESRLRAAELLREQGNFDDAARALDEAASDKGDDDRTVQIAIARSQLDEKRGDAARAARRLDETLAQPGNADDARLVLARAAVEERRGDWKNALARTEALLARHPRSVEALNFAGFVAADHGGDLARATKRLQAAVALSPGSGSVLDSLGWAFLRAGDLARADTFLEQAGRLEPGDPEILAHLGDLYARRQEHDRALATYRKALGLKPDERVTRELGERIRTLDAKSAAGR
jgi:tetratricopeptide (TPR) repeat protein